MSSATGIVINSPGVFLGIWAASGLPAFVLSAAAGYMTGLTTKDALRTAIEQGRYDQLAIVGAAGLAGMLLTQFGAVATIIAASDAASGREPSVGDALERAWSRFGAVIWTEAVVGVRVFLGLLLLIVPGIVMGIRYGFSQFVAALEPESGAAAAARSRDLIVPHMGKVVGNVLAIAALVIAAAFSFGLAGSLVQELVRAAAGDVAALGVAAVIRGAVSLLSAWNIAALTGLYAAISARTPRGA
jgi:hypothetical protein